MTNYFNGIFAAQGQQQKTGVKVALEKLESGHFELHRGCRDSTCNHRNKKCEGVGQLTLTLQGNVS